MTDIPVTQAVPVPVPESEPQKFPGEIVFARFNQRDWVTCWEYPVTHKSYLRQFRLPSDDEVAAAKRQRELARTRIRALRNTASTIGHVIRSELVVEELDWLLREVLAEPEVPHE